MENELVFIPLIIIAFIICFGGFWSFIVFITSRIGGWHTVAQQYAGEMSYFSQQFTWRSARFGFMNYKSVLTFSVSDEELGIAVLFLYRIGHAPLKIPWSEVHGIEKSPFIFPEVHLTFLHSPNKVLKIRKGLAEQIENAAGGNWTFERKA
ncbi:MAG: hypothetical protein ACI85U_003423 [Candidatus Promineifilaceae bacterium]|jgi:hypothetical protein